MPHIYKIITLFVFISFYTNAQESIQAKLLDSITRKPIPFATISINNNSGVISNDNGNFLIYLNKKASKKDNLFIRCMGYETKQKLVKNFTDSIILLTPKTIELQEVLITNKTYTAKEIIEKVKENIETNYDFGFVKSKLFYRESYYTNILKNDVKVKKTSIPEFNQKFIDSVLIAIEKNDESHTEILTNTYGRFDIVDSLKLDIIKALYMYDKDKEMSFKNYEEKLNTIIKKRVKRDSYFKIKSGIIGVKSNLDSTVFEDDNSKEVDQTEAIIEQQKKKEQERRDDFLKYRKTSISNLQRHSFIFEDSDINIIEKLNKYEFIIEDSSFLNDDFVYKISFKPKKNEDYSGTLYINADDFAIIRLDYANIKPLKTFNLFGINYKHNLKKGTLIYTKNSSNKYVLKYADLEDGNKFSIKRPIKIIEKNKHTRGRRKQNELSTDIHFIASTKTKQELIVFENTNITKIDFTNFKEKPKTEPIYLPKYDPEFWKGYNIIEPNQAIKNFKSIN